jgi:hypothetical protein
MVSVREQALDALFSVLTTQLAAADRTIVRNAVEPQKIPEAGFIILRDGDPGEPESVTLSPVRYAYEHNAELTILLKDKSAATRDNDLDTILVAVDAAITADRTLGGIVDYCESVAPDLFTEHDDGIIVKVAIVPIMMRYITNNPLS